MISDMCVGESPILDLQRWCKAQCNGDWEHSYGIVIETLDNPGWYLRIDLQETSLKGVNFEPMSELEPELEWIDCKVKDGRFVAAGGPLMLERMIEVFLDWVAEHFKRLDEPEAGR
jgi:hypothetical protein